MLAALRTVVPDLPDDIAARVEVTPPRDPAHGDMATNAALVAAKAARQPPAKLAAAIVERFDPARHRRGHRRRSRLRQSPPRSRRVPRPAARPSCAPAKPTATARIGAGTRVNVEYVSANPTGPMHIGHCRGAVVGDALANLLAKAGYAVTKEYYINDAGAQVTALAWAAYWRYLQAIGTPLTEEEFSDEVPGGLQYRGEYLIPVGAATRRNVTARRSRNPIGGIAAPEVWLDIVRDFTIDAMMREIREDLRAARRRAGRVQLRTRPGRQRRRRRDRSTGCATQGLIYEGVLEPPKGKTPDDWEPRPQTLFRATQFGDDVDRPLRKSDGSNTYFANDIAYHADKIARGFDVLIDVLGADHGGYVKRMQAAVNALSAERRDASKPCSARSCTSCAAASRCACPSAPAPTSPCATCSTKSARTPCASPC